MFVHERVHASITAGLFKKKICLEVGKTSAVNVPIVPKFSQNILLWVRCIDMKEICLYDKKFGMREREEQTKRLYNSIQRIHRHNKFPHIPVGFFHNFSWSSRLFHYSTIMFFVILCFFLFFVPFSFISSIFLFLMFYKHF